MMKLLDQLIEKFPNNPDIYSRYLGEPSLQELVWRLIESYQMPEDFLLGMSIRQQLSAMMEALTIAPELYKDYQTEYYLTIDEHILKARVAGTGLDDVPAEELKLSVVTSIIQLDLASWLELQIDAISTLYGRAIT